MFTRILSLLLVGIVTVTGCGAEPLAPQVVPVTATAPVRASPRCIILIRYTENKHLEKGRFNAHLDCCTTDDDCVRSSYGTKCVSVDGGKGLLEPFDGFNGLCQECDPAAQQASCGEGESCAAGEVDVTPERLRSLALTFEGPTNRPTFTCKARQ